LGRLNPVTSTDRLLDIVDALDEAGIHYLVMGGHTVRFYGLERQTVDFDFHLSLAPRGRLRLLLVVPRSGCKDPPQSCNAQARDFLVRFTPWNLRECERVERRSQRGDLKQSMLSSVGVRFRREGNSFVHVAQFELASNGGDLNRGVETTDRREQPLSLRVTSMVLDLGLGLMDDDIFRKRWQPRAVTLELFAAVVIFGRWREDFEDYSWIE
jgi:hypothetical protein